MKISPTPHFLAAVALAALLPAHAQDHGHHHGSAHKGHAHSHESGPKGSGPARPVGGHSHEAFMGAYDVNRDGKVTRDEFDTVRKQRFMAADTNGDGWLSEAEYVAEFEARLKKQYESEGKQPDEKYQNSMKQAYVRFGIVDKDKDGKYTIEEEIASADKTFTNADTNGDGVVDARDKKEEKKAEAKP